LAQAVPLALPYTFVPEDEGIATSLLSLDVSFSTPTVHGFVESSIWRSHGSSSRRATRWWAPAGMLFITNWQLRRNESLSFGRGSR